MDNLQRDMEKSARRVFKLFFGSRLYLKKRYTNYDNDIVGVVMILKYKGRKKISFYMEHNTIRTILKRLTGQSKITAKSTLIDVVGEMANMITGSAVSTYGDGMSISVPKKLKRSVSIDLQNAMNFSSRLGRFSISIVDM